MAQINFKNLFVEGFSSLQTPTEFPLERIGVNLVKGINGAGKTTTFSALCWGLMGINLKGVTSKKVATWKEKQLTSFKGTKVSITFDVVGGQYEGSYMVARHIDYKGTTLGLKGDSRLMIFYKELTTHRDFEQADLMGKERYKDDQNKFIEHVVGVSSTAFLNSVLFGQRMKRLVEADNADKRELFEELFAMEFVDIAKDKAKDKITKLSFENKELGINTDNFIREEEQLAKEYNEKEELERNFRKKKKTTVESIQQEISAANQRELAIDDETRQAEKDSYGYDENKLPALQQDILTLRADVATANAKKRTEVIDAARTRSDVAEKAYIDAKRAIDEQIAEADKKMWAFRKADDEATRQLQDAYNATLDNIKKLDKKEEEYEAEIGKAEGKKKKLETDLANVAETCTYCNSPLKPDEVDKVKSNIRKLIEKESEVLTVLQPKLAALGVLNDNTHETAELQYKSLQEAINTSKAKMDGSDESKELNRLLGMKAMYEGATQDTDAILIERLDAKRNLALVEATAAVTNYMECSEIDIQLKLLEKKHAELSLQLVPMAEAYKKLAVLRERKTNIQREITGIQQRLNAANAEQIPHVNLQEIFTRRGELNREISVMKSKAKLLTDKIGHLEWWVNKGLGAYGLKSFIFNAMLNNLNLAVQKYAERLGVRVQFSVDVSKATKPFTTTCYKNEVEKDYDELSGGEKQRVDVCLAFAMHDLVASKIDANILIMDEIFEGLDNAGIETVFDLIRVKAGDGKSVYVVTHSETIDSLNCRTIWVEQNDYTTLIS